MNNLNNIPSSGTWGDAASRLNDNFNKIKQAVTTVENASKNNKGYFSSLSALNTAFPSPKAGQTAYVYDEASSTKYYIYNAVNGAWVATSIEAPSVGVDLAEYTKTGGSTKTTQDIDDIKANHGYDSSPKTLKQVDDAKLDKSSVKQVLGASTTDVMSQKAVTDEINYINTSYVKKDDNYIKEQFLSESYLPQAPIYTDGLINSPFNIIWADSATGTITLTRNSDNLTTKAVATHTLDGVTKTLTCDITRDSDGNATNITITII